MRATADVMGAPPIEEFPARARRDQYLAGRPATQRRPDSPEGIRVAPRANAPIAHLEGEHGEVAVHAPAVASQIGQLSAWREAQLARPRAYRRLAIGMVSEVHNQVNAR